MNKTLIMSKEYENLNWNSWDERHNEEMQKKYGVWRWAGMHEHKDMILSEIEAVRGEIIDIGGALAPLGFGSIIVDMLESDINSNPIHFQKINDIPGKVDMIFSSHCLEHVEDIERELMKWFVKLRPAGKVILHVPSILNSEHWHPDVKPEHNYIFAIHPMSIADLKHEVYIDKLMERYFSVEFCEVVGDASILLIARKVG